MKINLIIFLVLVPFCCKATTVLTPNTISKGETSKITTGDVLNNQKAVTSNIEISFAEPDLKKCKKVGTVRTTKPIEMWQKGEACVIRHMELKRQTVLLSGSHVFVDPIQDCDKPVYEGQAYCCFEKCEKIRFK